jgi:exopolysaccharide biosynthesis protein
LRVYAVRVDLTAPGVRFLATPSNGDRPKETDSAKVSTFLAKNRCQVAVNASPFAPVTNVEGDPQDIQGLSVSNGDRYSRPHPNYASLVISRDNRVRVVEPPGDVSPAHNGVGGFGMLLRNGENVGSDDARHPRTAAGVSEDGRYLFLLVIDGRQPNYSIGTTTRETASWLRHIGAHSGLNLDGGGSTTLAVADGQGGVMTVNRPIHNGIPGNERPVGNHLGIFAKPLAGTAP